MLGRFAVEVTYETSPITMQVQFNMVGKNGTANETGTTFTGASTASYKVSQFFTFATGSILFPPSGFSRLRPNTQLATRASRWRRVGC